MWKYDICINAFVKGNLGDDLFIKTICLRYPNTRFVICGEKEYQNCFYDINNLDYKCYNTLFNKYFYRLRKLPSRIINVTLKKLGIKKDFVKKDYL